MTSLNKQVTPVKFCDTVTITYLLICICPNWFSLSVCHKLMRASFWFNSYRFLNGRKSPSVANEKGPQFFLTDFPENCKWTKTEESWGTALTSKWLGQWRACAQPGCVQTISFTRYCSSIPDLHYCFPHKLYWTTNKLSLCILYLLCSNVCQTLFHVGSVLSEPVCTFHQQTKSTHPVRWLPCLELLCDILYIAFMCVSEYILTPTNKDICHNINLVC